MLARSVKASIRQLLKYDTVKMYIVQSEQFDHLRLCFVRDFLASRETLERMHSEDPNTVLATPNLVWRNYRQLVMKLV